MSDTTTPLRAFYTLNEMRKFILLLLIASSITVAHAQEKEATEDKQIKKIKDLNSKAGEMLAEGDKSKAFEYMDSIRTISNIGCKKSSMLYVFENVQKKDVLAEILGMFDRLRKMSAIEGKKANEPNNKILEEKEVK